MKKLFLILATLTVLLTTTAVPSMADGGPLPTCTDQGCKKPPQL